MIMKASDDRILTTHVGSLPRSQAVTDVVFAQEKGQPHKNASEIIREAVAKVVAKQADTGIDVISDGEMSKISYATYIKDRISGFEGDSPREPPADLEDFPGFLERLASTGGTPTYKRPCCVSDVKVFDMDPVKEDIENFNSALFDSEVCEGVHERSFSWRDCTFSAKPFLCKPR